MNTTQLKIRYILEVVAAALVTTFIAWGESQNGLAATYVVGIGLLIWVGIRHMLAIGRHWA
ncbi:hypothetical protein D1823_19135 (plasmid) [Ruegeria sp. AD91A]|nr:hypothetical protein D1823_19135 [Ruegeria sp. AD91A]